MREDITYVASSVICTLHWRHNERDGVSNDQTNDCLIKRLFGHRSKKPCKLRVTGLSAGNSPVTGKFPVQRASNADNVSIRWRHRDRTCSAKDRKRVRLTHVGTTISSNSDSKWLYIIVLQLVWFLVVCPKCVTDMYTFQPYVPPKFWVHVMGIKSSVIYVIFFA